MDPVRCTRGSVSVAHLTGLVMALACVGALGRLGVGMATAIADDAEGASSSGAAMAVAKEAGLEQVALSGTRYAEAAVREIRSFAAAVPQGETQLMHGAGASLAIPHLPSRETLFEFARAHAGISTDADLARRQSENWAELVDRAFDEVLSHGLIPGNGGATTGKGLEAALDFNEGPRPNGTWTYNAHGERTRMYVIPKLVITTDKNGIQRNAAVGEARTIPIADVVADLRAAGHRGEPLLLDSCKTGCDAHLPDTISRVLANELQLPVIAPTRPVWMTRPTKTQPHRARLIGDDVDARGYAIPLGNWVLVMPDTWGGAVHRGSHNLPD